LGSSESELPPRRAEEGAVRIVEDDDEVSRRVIGIVGAGRHRPDRAEGESRAELHAVVALQQLEEDVEALPRAAERVQHQPRRPGIGVGGRRLAERHAGEIVELLDEGAGGEAAP